MLVLQELAGPKRLTPDLMSVTRRGRFDVDFYRKVSDTFWQMLFRDRPLSANTADTQLYVARPALEDGLLRPMQQGRNVLLLGDAGSGKTTLMRRVEVTLRAREMRAAWVNAALAESAADLLILVNEAISSGSASSEGRHEEESANMRLLSLTRTLGRQQPTAILVDGLTDPQVAFDVFGRLRDELWSARHPWLVAARPKDAAALRSPPADAFWANVVEIPPLDEREVREFLSRGLDDQERERMTHIPVAGYHPRLLIRAVEAGLSSTEEESPEEGWIEALFQQAGLLGRSEEIALRELVGLGRPASAHDPELLEVLGWSRPYVQRILSHLEGAHLVRSVPEPSGERTGRPRKLYEPNPRAFG